MENLTREFVDKLVTYESTIKPGYIALDYAIDCLRDFSEAIQRHCEKLTGQAIERALEKHRGETNYKRLRGEHDI